MKEEINNIKNEALAQIFEARSTQDLEELRISYLGRKGKIAQLLEGLKKLDQEDRKKTGILINEAKNAIVNSISEKITGFSNKSDINKNWFDPTMPGIKPKIGHLHLITKAIEEISDVFKSIGIFRVRYPEVEWDWFSFEALNFSKDHPARDNWETFIVDSKVHPKYGSMVLTPHTSSGQIRELQRVKVPPIRMINIAKCYRRQSDISHSMMFHQFEGLVVDKGISIVNLKATLDYFAKNYFDKDRITRLRPYNFPFTEPSFEVDITCGICKGTGKLKDGNKCKLCKSGWLELGGAGMVHPNVLKNCGIDVTKYSGFAFGWGVERVLMMKANLNISDLRILYSDDLRFLQQF